MESIGKEGLKDLLTFITDKELEYNLKITLVDDMDAEFIINIRNSFKARFLNGSVSEINEQVKWIHEYKIREKEKTEYYFIFWNKCDRIGTIRFIKIDESTFESGSWLFISGIPFSVSVKAELFCKDFAFDFCNLENCYFYINRKNKQVLRYHSLFNSKLIKEDKDHLYFILSKENYHLNKDRILLYCS
jgi:hypothetical protein